jgi:hypothetical protein
MELLVPPEMLASDEFTGVVGWGCGEKPTIEERLVGSVGWQGVGLLVPQGDRPTQLFLPSPGRE